MAVFGRARVEEQLGTPPVTWTRKAFAAALSGLDPKKPRHRRIGENYRAALLAAMRAQVQGNRLVDAAMVTRMPPSSLPIEVRVYREYYENVSQWLR
jgi:hypothetical protein